MLLLLLLILHLSNLFRTEFIFTVGFIIHPSSVRTVPFKSSSTTHHTSPSFSSAAASSSSLHAVSPWFFPTVGGAAKQKEDAVHDVVDVRIERPTSNSRRIRGAISIRNVAIADVWSILTDYDRLSRHVPNVKESRRVVRENNNNNNNNNNRRSSLQQQLPGDGSYQCQLYQVGAQKIIGFDFSASVTMDMTEQIISTNNNNKKQHMIHFACVESQFFRVFDGSWTVCENEKNGEVVCTYDVVVKPNGPVPIAALEWQIKSEVPNNLRAVKKAAKQVAAAAAAPTNQAATSAVTTTHTTTTTTVTDDDDPTNTDDVSLPRNLVVTAARMARGTQRVQHKITAVMADWECSETMGTYL